MFLIQFYIIIYLLLSKIFYIYIFNINVFNHINLYKFYINKLQIISIISLFLLIIITFNYINLYKFYINKLQIISIFSLF